MARGISDHGIPWRVGCDNRRSSRSLCRRWWRRQPSTSRWTTTTTTTTTSVQPMQRNTARCNMPHAIGSVHSCDVQCHELPAHVARRPWVRCPPSSASFTFRVVFALLHLDVLCAMLSCTLHGCAWQAVAAWRVQVGFGSLPIACCALSAVSFRSPGVRLHAVPTCCVLLGWRVRQATFSYP